jgi:hypothetical protein
MDKLGCKDASVLRALVRSMAVVMAHSDTFGLTRSAHARLNMV